MKKELSAYSLGATLYMPATRIDIVDTIVTGKIAGLRSLVICLEDAVSEQDMPFAMNNLKGMLDALSEAKQRINYVEWPLVFIRPRNEQIGLQLTAEYDLSAIDGFVLPKFNLSNLNEWTAILELTHLCWMPTLETEDVFDVNAMLALVSELKAHKCRDKIIALRIGGNDLMNCVSLRRSRELTLYDGPMGYVIKMLVAVFASKGFSLTAPVCEHIDDHRLLEKELELDLAHGLVGKTAIHPNQIPVIQRALMVSSLDHQDALRIINSSQAVFKAGGAMCEPATHRRWAKSVLDRVHYFGVSTAVSTSSVQIQHR
ncbi:HpcH/HpaI aldolase/citrate lyase family protein [Shewanella glacialipiscicola]|uniref:Citrate lyase subunit beta n=1 Tax=Shewanella glacialipiscicola TaxID=614069 RepID=A0ABQ6J5G3_9GAMM|nr:HpcH/HpaI aldolase/citrate lyase family protein [Shewanella glacialipiscicola]MCL1087696.1 HpcH/HpaI aldolase/citrate lyase family protein [Shewanella glacialipiscicola]GIU12826.1 citrate lyase subunit beta [Shewanella glacialipiscicola]GMA82116.1 citrate lyase subunit beta [Shewanella glacialipiscicola]